MINRADVKIVSDDVNQILSNTIADYENRTGKQLQPAHIEQSIIQTYAYRELLVRKGVNEAFLQTFPQFATGVALDLCGEPMGCYRLENQPAICTLRFISEHEHQTTVIPEGTLVAVNDVVAFVTEIEVVLTASNSYVDVNAVCTVLGDSGNGWQPGQVKDLKSEHLLSAGVTVSNIDVTQGGIHLEDDDAYRVRILLAPEAFTTCGSRRAYEYHTKSVSQYISDVSVHTPVGGTVKVVVLTKDGLPSSTLLSKVTSYLSAEDKRPLCDVVNVVAPEEVTYEVTATLFLLKDVSELAVKTAATKSLNKYLTDRFNVLGKDVVPLEITHALKVFGVYNVELISPGLTKLNREQWSRCTSVNIEISEEREDG